MNVRAFSFPFLLFLAALFAVNNVFADSDSEGSSSLQVSPASVSMKVGNTATLAVSNASGSVSAESNDKTVVSASYSNRVVTLKGLKAGATYVKVKDSKTEKKIPVTVSAATSGGLSVSPASVAMNVGGTASVIVSNASGAVTATSSNPSVATVSYAGGTATVKAIKAGSASITIKDSKTSVAVSVSVVTTPVASTGYTLLAWNDLGMHCMDGVDFSVFSILPPYNTLHAQLKDKAGKLIGSNVTLTYEAVADSTGSINTISSTKTNFWTWSAALFGLNPAPDIGLMLDGLASGVPAPGNRAPSLAPAPLSYNSQYAWFEAEGLPVTPIDDAGQKNFYPTVKVVAKDLSGKVLATTTTVLPVSDEMTCKGCHASISTGNAAAMAARPRTGWVFDANAEKDWKKNILKLHDQNKLSSALYTKGLAQNGYNASGLLATANAGRPVLCVACHASNAYFDKLSLKTVMPGVAGISPFTQALHTKHATVKDPATLLALDSIGNRTSCYACHPGSATQCLRGAMGKAVDATGKPLMSCQSCHGNMAQVGDAARQGWFNEPTCESCHNSAAPGKRALAGVNANGIPVVPIDHTFATNANTPVAGLNLYRFSKGHGGLQCEACHGATHAIYPSSHADDNTQSIAVQGHAGTVAECTACHTTVPTTVNGGPHGMHTTGDAWVSSHKKASKTGCDYCHGTTSAGTPLSAVKVTKTLAVENGTKTFAAGTQISCYSCHNGPNP